jgi:fibronectin-binding autotransporter adhesin
MKNILPVMALLCCLTFFLTTSAQTSWRGTSSTNWSNSSNWTNGVPTSSVDAIIGDANFTGGNQPTINSSSSCKSLTLGGVVASTMTMTRSLTVSGNITINSNGTISQGRSTLSLTGNWLNNGTYTSTSGSARVNFSGVTQSIAGSSTSAFRKITVNASSTTTLTVPITISGSNSILTVNGILNPGESPTYLVTATSITVSTTGKIKVYAATFSGNYTYSGTFTMSGGSTVEYASSSLAQTVSNSFTYSTLQITGGTVKTLAGNLPSLNSTSSTRGNIYVDAGTLDMSTYTANRGTTYAGGTLRVSNGAILKIGGTNGFPSNYASRILQLTSTVQYAGTSQTILAETYGNLQLLSSTGAVTKTMPVTAFTIEGDFTSSIGSGTSVSYTAGAAITINGVTTIGAGTTFNASSYTHNFGDNWINNGTFTGSTSTLSLNGENAVISGTGTFNINNITFIAAGISASATALSVSGNISTSGQGQFTHNAGSTITMSGSSKTISGTDISFSNLTISGSVTNNNTFVITGNLTVNGSIIASAGTITMNGTSKTIAGTGTISFYNLTASGTISCNTSFSLASAFTVTGSFTASAGTGTFTSSSSLTGTANLYNVTINGTSFRLSTNTVLGIANAFTIIGGTLDVTSSAPNTVNYNGSSSQTVTGTTYDNLIFSGASTKTAGAAITVNRDLTINSGSTFNASSYSHQIKRNWSNSGTFNASSSTVSFTGTTDGAITGATTFNILTVNKSSSTNIITLTNNVSTGTVNMTTGAMTTGTATISITAARTGNGIILGNIQRTHSFSAGTAYAFEGPDNTITFPLVNTVSSITVSVAVGGINDFPNNGSINREYNVSITGTYVAGTLRLHYEDAELNGNNEATMDLWSYDGSNWVSAGKTSNSTTSNYVELTGLTGVAGRWSCANSQTVVRWNGSVSSDWNNAANWTTVQGSPTLPPSSNEIVQIGTAAFTNQPIVNTSANAKSILFGSAQAATLTLNTGGSLTVAGNISGTWSANATHTINTNNQNLTVNGSMVLSDGTTNHIINLGIGGGTTSIAGSLTQNNNAAVTFSGNGELSIGGNYMYTAGTFTGGSGTVIYTGAVSQIVAPVDYYHLSINKSAGIASINSNTTIGGNLTVSAGELNNLATTTITGNVTVESGAALENYLYLHPKGNWTINGTYTASGASIYFDGTGDQYVSASTFNNLNIDKNSGTLYLTGNATINGDLIITAGTINLQTYTCNRSIQGGSMSMSNGTQLLAGGSNNFPANFNSYSLATNSTVTYNGSATQTVAGVPYGNLSFSNGNSNAKTMAASAIINGNLNIASGATLHSGGYTIELRGNWTNGGTFTPSTGTVLLQGSAKTIAGNTIFNKLTINGSYTVDGSDIVLNGLINVTTTGSFDAGSGTSTVNADLINSGTLFSSGTTTFTGNVVQTLRLINAISSTSTGVVNFNGSVSPVLNSTSSPTFAILNINNTGGVNPSMPWYVFTAMNVNSGGIFNGGVATHYIHGNFANTGTVTSTGKMLFTGSSAKSVNLGSSTFTSTGNVEFGGSGLITLAGTAGTVNDVTISNTHSSGVTSSSNWNLTGDWVISDNSIFNASSYSYSIAGNIESDGTLNGGSSTFTMSSATGELTGSANTEFNHFVISGFVTSLSDFKVAGNYTNNGTYDGTGAIMIMSGSTSATIGGTTAPSSLAQLQVAKTSGALVTMNVSLTDVMLLYIQSGTLFTSTYSITQDGGGGFLLIDDAATLRLGGTNSLPGFSGYGLDANSNVDYAGTTQSIGNAAVYGNLWITAAGTKNAIVPFVTLGNFTLSSGTFTSSISVTHTIGGNWLMSGGTFTNTNITIVMNGTADQSVSSTGAFNNLTINKSAGQITLLSAVTVNNTLNLTSGKVSLGNYNLTIGNSGSITNANDTKYIVTGGTGTLNMQVAAAGSKVYPVGTSTLYHPATIALTAGSTTDVFSVRMFPAAYVSGTSGSLITANAVNATWMINEAVNGGSNATVTLQWPGSTELFGFTRSLSRLAHYTSGEWDYGTVDISASGSNPYTVTRSGFTTFSPFAVGMLNALPLKWLSIGGHNVDNDNYINWSTAEEVNTDYFIIENSVNGIDFFEIGRVRAAGNSSVIEKYNFTHQNISSTLNYYRIRQLDIDGRFTISKIIRINAAPTNTEKISLLGNPVQGSPVVSVAASYAGVSTVLVSDATGRLVYKQNEPLKKGDNVFTIKTPVLLPGSYFITIITANGSRLTSKFIYK